jgi:hypothetical protein
MEIDRAISLLGAQYAGADHQARAEQGRARTIDAVDRHLADRDDRVGRAENRHCRDQGEVGHCDRFHSRPAAASRPCNTCGLEVAA